MPRPFPKIIHTALAAYLKRRHKKLQTQLANPEDTQKQVLQYLIYRAIRTEWGVNYRYDKIRSYEDFRERVPVNDYETFYPWIERTMKGEQNICWPQKIDWFAKSSGTTSAKSKFIPVSKDNLKENHFQGGEDLLACYLNQVPDSKLFTGKTLILGGSHEINKLDSGSRYGDISAVMLQNLPYAALFFRSPKLETALMNEWEAKIEKMALESIRQNITQIAGVPTWTIVLIRKIFEITGKNNLRDVWPNLELYTHGGVSFTPYREQFKELIRGNGMYYFETFNASEGFFALQDREGADDMALLTGNGVFYEFVTLDQWDSEDPEYIPLWEVEKGKKYAMIISTNAGLWRYRIGDTVQFTSTEPYRLRIAGRVKHFINAFGEELMIENADKAIAETCRLTGSEVREYTAAPIFMTTSDKGGHEWLIEFTKEPINLKNFRDILDKELQKVNSDYEAKRYKDLALVAPLIHKLKQDAFYDWLKSKGKLGGQHKVPRLSNSREYVKELITYKI